MIPKDLLDQSVMLAKQSKHVADDLELVVKTLSERGYWFDLKLDGVRALAFVENGSVTLINRLGRDVTFRYPDLVFILQQSFAGMSIVLDGEVVVLDENGHSDFAKTHRRDAQENARSATALAAEMPATFVAFDLLWMDNDDYRRIPFLGRRGLLNTFVGPRQSPYLKIVEGMKDTAIWEYVKANGLEGVIAKDPKGSYSPGRSQKWIKIKPTKSLSALVMGYENGEGRRANTVGALFLALADKTGQLQPIGKVGSGFTDANLAIVLDRLSRPETPLVVEVEYQEVSPNGQLRFPVFKGIRDDVNILDCTTEQLEGETVDA